MLTIHVYPMVCHARQLLNFKYYVDAKGDKKEMEKLLTEAKKKEGKDSKLYFNISASAEYPGKFLLSYMPKNRVSC